MTIVTLDQHNSIVYSIDTQVIIRSKLLSSGVTENLACRERGERAKGIIMLNQKKHGCLGQRSWNQSTVMETRKHEQRRRTRHDLIDFYFLFVHMLLHDRDFKNHLHSYGNLSVTQLIMV